MEVTDKIRQNFLEHDLERRVSKDFPEYQKFFTGKLECRKATIVNAIDNPKIDMLEELKEGKLGDVIDVYVNFLQEEKKEKTIWGKIRRSFTLKRMDYDREYLQERLKKALNSIAVRW